MAWHDPRTGDRHEPPAAILEASKAFPLGTPAMGYEGVLYMVAGYLPDGRLLVSPKDNDDDLYALDFEALRQRGEVTLVKVEES